MEKRNKEQAVLPKDPPVTRKRRGEGTIAGGWPAASWMWILFLDINSVRSDQVGVFRFFLLNQTNTCVGPCAIAIWTVIRRTCN
jgi:hypothetical protein